jgi:serine/threonine-protein kinase
VSALPADALEPGEPVDESEGPQDFGEFRTVRKIGEDALGILYKAMNVDTGEEVALKVVDLERARGRKFAERFVREARKAASLDHEALKRVTAAGRERGQLYYASEYISGKSVRQLIESEGRVSIKAANRIIRTVAEGLKHAHEQGVFHGNIRPSSILVTPDGSVKLSDTGVAKNIRENIERLVRVHGLMSFYMAPELATPQGKMDARCDIFELGATYYHMITGKPPFEGTSPLQVFMLMAEREAIPVHQVNASVPVQVSDVIKKMMAPEPEDRYQSMDELLEALRRTGDLQTISELPVNLNFPAAEAVPEGVKPKATTVRKVRPVASTGRSSRREAKAGGGSRSSGKGSARGGADEGKGRGRRHPPRK